MEFGYFSMPSHPPERGLKDGHDWDLQTIRWLDELGFSEVWIGEHHTAPWEPHPAPDLLIAQAMLQTKRIRIGPGGFLLPYHHPAELANRVAMLDHLSGGRLNFGIAAQRPAERLGDVQRGRHVGHEPRDDPRGAGHHPEAVAADGPSTRGQVLDGGPGRDEMFGFLKPHIKPLQQPHPPIGVAGLSKNSDTLKMAGEHGFLPMSLNLNPGYVGEPLGQRRGRRAQDRPDAEPQRLAAGARGLRRRDRRGSLEAVGRRHDGPDDAGVFPAVAGDISASRNT